jgi:hypothetical protein
MGGVLVDLVADLVVLKNRYARMNVRLLEKTVRLIDKLDVKSVKMLVELLSLLSLNCVLVVAHQLGKERKERILLVD